MSHSFVYWPYDEVSVRLSDDRNKVVVQTPWLQATADVTDEARERIEDLVNKLTTGELGGEDLPLINWFFGRFASYPLCYMLPKPRKGDLDQHAVVDETLLPLSPEQLLDRATDGVDVAAVVAGIARGEWHWDVGTALKFAHNAERIQPESFFSVARRFHLLDVLDINRGNQTFQDIAALKGDAFAKAAAIIVRQNHYVTEQCQQALAPALETAAGAQGEVKEFMAEENGHDLILSVAMKSVAEDPNAVPVAEATKALMQLLAFCGQRNFLAFAMVVDGFERSTYQKMDPLAKLLAQGGFDKAAKQINRHMQINDAGGHENVALGFLTRMDLVDEAYATEAMRLAELVTLVMNSVTSAAWKLYQDS